MYCKKYENKDRRYRFNYKYNYRGTSSCRVFLQEKNNKVIKYNNNNHNLSYLPYTPLSNNILCNTNNKMKKFIDQLVLEYLIITYN